MPIHTLPRPTGFIGALASRIVAAIARRITGLNAHIDAQPPIVHHRMGAWEARVSPAAQQAVTALHVEAEKSDHHEDDRSNRILSENG